MVVTRFVALFGMYYSLQYLSLSDATVLSFLSPLTTAVAGALLLNESFTRKEAFAGSEIIVIISPPTSLILDREQSSVYLVLF
jgi:drug/metabolite transporter (DMT)-like permease